MRNHVEEYYRALQKPGGLRNAIIVALLIHVALAVAITAYISYRPARPEVLQVGIMIVPGEVKDPNKPTSVAAPAPQQGSAAKPEPPKKEEVKPEPPKKEEPPKPEPKPEPKKEEPKPKEEEKKEEEPKKEEPKPKPEKKKEEPKKIEEPKKKEEPKEEKKEPEKEEEKEPEKPEPPKKTDAAKKEKEKQAIKPTPGAKKTEDAELDMVMADVAEFSDTTNPNGIEGPVTIQPGDMTALGLWPSRVKSMVDRVWRLPSGVSISSQPCTLGFSVDRNGAIVGSVEIVMESDNPSITESALQALEVVKFPPLPDSYTKPTVYVEYNFKVTPQ